MIAPRLTCRPGDRGRPGWAASLLVVALILALGAGPGPDDRPTSRTTETRGPAPKADAPKPAGGSASTGPAPAAPQVVSQARRKERGRGGSEFLRLPGDDRYGGSGDPDDGLPWRQASFFGIHARGSFFVYVVDCSGSMVLDDRLARAKDELRRSIRQLVEPQRFQVVFYNDRAIPMPGGLPRSASLLSKGQLLEWLRLIGPDGETDPRPALGLALAMRPDAIFLLSDGEFPEGTVEDVARLNTRKLPIHCVDLSGETGAQLERIARDSGGQFVTRRPVAP